MGVLSILVEAAGEPMTREEILGRVWSDVVVGEDVLTNSIHQLRKAFDDDARNPRYIETIPRRGYRLIAPVTALKSPSVARFSSERAPLFFGLALMAAAVILVILPGVRLAQSTTDTKTLIAQAQSELESGESAGADRAIELLHDAIEQAPRSAAAWSMLARASLRSANKAGVDPARDAAQTALTLDPSLADAHLAMAEVLMSEWKWRDAERHILRAINSAPESAAAHSAYAELLLVTGHREQAHREVARSLSAPAPDTSAHLAAGMVHSMTGDPRFAVRQFSIVLARYPRHEVAQRNLAKLAARATTASPPNPEQLTRHIDEVMRKRERRPALVAALLSEAGDQSRAAEWFDRAVRERDSALLFLRFDQRWQSLADSAAFRDALACAGVPGP